MRRDPAAIFAAHDLDPARCELFVEGSADRRFLFWLVGESRDPNATVIEIDAVDVPDVGSGGNRARLLAFARLAVCETDSIRCLADADTDRLVSREVPTNVWLTDFRALESYVLRADCVEKLLRLGVGTDEGDPDKVLRAVLARGRELAALRMVSEVDDLCLPFQDLRLERYITVDGFDVVLDIDTVIRVLLQNAGISLAEFNRIKGRLEQIAACFAKIDDLEFVHGKDAFTMLSAVLTSRGISRSDAPRLIWTSFESAMAAGYSVLCEVVAFLRTCSIATSDETAGQHSDPSGLRRSAC